MYKNSQATQSVIPCNGLVDQVRIDNVGGAQSIVGYDEYTGVLAAGATGAFSRGFWGIEESIAKLNGASRYGSHLYRPNNCRHALPSFRLLLVCFLFHLCQFADVMDP